MDVCIRDGYSSHSVDGDYSTNYHSKNNGPWPVWLMIDLESDHFVIEIKFSGRRTWLNRRGNLKVNIEILYFIVIHIVLFYPD